MTPVMDSMIEDGATSATDDTASKIAWLLEAAEKVAPSPWEIDRERQDDAPDRHDEFLLSDARGYRLCGTENADYRFGLIETKYDADGAISWNDHSLVLMRYIASVNPAAIRGLLDERASLLARIKALEEENGRMQK